MGAIILEGLRGSGKTTLSRKFVERGFQYRPFSRGPLPGENYFVTFFDNLSDARYQQIVFDRLHLSEMVYGPALRGVSTISETQCRCLNQLLDTTGGYIVYCHVPFGVRSRARELDEDFELRLEEAYLRVLNELCAGHVRVFDYTQDDIEILFEEVACPWLRK